MGYKIPRKLSMKRHGLEEIIRKLREGDPS